MMGTKRVLELPERTVGTSPEKRGVTPTSFFHGNNPITESTIIQIQFIDLVCVSNCSFQRSFLGQDVFELHGVRRPSSDAWRRW